MATQQSRFRQQINNTGAACDAVRVSTARAGGAEGDGDGAEAGEDDPGRNME